jgi:hypothetical protein
MCRKVITMAQVTRISKDESTPIVDELTNRHGVKMAALIRCLNQILNDDPTHRVIVFSQWDPMLTRIGATLRLHVYVEHVAWHWCTKWYSTNSDTNLLVVDAWVQEIDSVYCRGTVTSRNKALNEFKSTDTTNQVSAHLSLRKAEMCQSFTQYINGLICIDL